MPPVLGNLISGDEQPRFVEAGAFIKLDDYYEKYGPNLKKMFGPYMKRLRYSKENPFIYVVGASLNSGVDAKNLKPGMGFHIQHRVVKELGYPKITTLKEAEDVIKQYIEKYPTSDGKPNISVTTIAEDWRWLCAPGNWGAFATGKPDDGQWYVDPQTFESTFRFYLPDHKEVYKWMNHMNDVGLLDNEAFVQKYDTYVQKVSNGNVLALIDQRWQSDQGNNNLRDTGKFDRQYGYYPTMLTADMKSGDFRDMGYSAGWGIGITTSCKDPQRAFQFLDWMTSDEAQILIRWGEEGKDYIINADGKREVPKEIWEKRLNDAENYYKESGVTVYNYPYPMWGDGVVDSTGQLYNPDNTVDQIIANQTDAEKEVLAGYGVKIWKELYPNEKDLVQSKWGAAWQIPIPGGSEIEITLNKCNDIMKQGIPKAVLRKPADFDAVWADLMEQLKKAGVEKMNADFTQLLKNRVELWNN